MIVSSHVELATYQAYVYCLVFGALLGLLLKTYRSLDQWIYFSNFFLAFLSPLATVVVKYFMGDGLVRFQFLVCILVCTLKGGNYWLWQKFGTWPSAFKIVLIIIDHSIPGLVTWWVALFTLVLLVLFCKLNWDSQLLSWHERLGYPLGKNPHAIIIKHLWSWS